MLLGSLLPHFWYTGYSSLVMCYFLKHFDISPRKMRFSWWRTGKLITPKLFCVCLRANVFVCACMCVVYVRVCVRGAPLDHSSAYRRHCMLYTLCNECTAVHYSMLSKSAESFSAWVVTIQLLHLAAILKRGTTCQTASLAESKICVCNLAYSHYRCPLFSAYPT